MAHYLVKQLYTQMPSANLEDVTVNGWVRTTRESKAFAFVELNDGTFFDETLGQGFLRLNFACPHARLLEGLKRLAEAMNDPE